MFEKNVIKYDDYCIPIINRNINIILGELLFSLD